MHEKKSRMDENKKNQAVSVTASPAQMDNE